MADKCTKCYDTLIEMAKKKVKLIKPNVDPTERDVDLETKVKAEKSIYESTAEKIYNAEKEKLEAKYNAGKMAADASEPILKAQFTQERFNSTDVKKYGETGIKTTFAKEMQKLNEGIEKSQEKELEELEKNDEEEKEIKHKDSDKLAKDKAKKSDDKHNAKKAFRQAKEATEEARGAIIQNDIIGAASEIGKGTDKDIDDMAKSYEESLNTYKKMVEDDARSFGEQEGAKLVQTYNNEVAEAAKIAYNNIQKNLTKAKVEIDKAKQVAILQLGALFGL